MKKVLINQNDIKILSMYAHNKPAVLYMKQKLKKLKRETERYPIKLGYFNTSP